MEATEASRTAVLVCQGRAVADRRLAAGRFSDPTAMAFLRDDERAPVVAVRRGVPPRGWAARMEYEMLRASAEVMVPRTVGIDDACRERMAAQLVILGAGLDGRAWRMGELAGVHVYEVDHPASQADKQERSGDLRPLSRSLRFVPVDFSQEALGAALAASGHEIGAATTWVWEGVVPYLTPNEVEATMGLVNERSAPGSRLIVNYQAPSTLLPLGRLAAQAITRATKRRDPLANEPRRSAWTADTMADLCRRHGFTVGSDTDLLTIAYQLGLQPKNPRSVRHGRLAVADKETDK